MSLQGIDWAATLQPNLDNLREIFSTSSSVTPVLIPGERRTVAVLFLDLEGFTAMSEQLDHETIHTITSTVMSRLSRMVEFHGGYVDKFEGDRIMALFGAEKAHENDCVRAVSCAMKMIGVVQEFSALLRNKGFTVDSRSGISYGDVTVAPDPSGHITAIGDIVNIASRIEETAETGTVQVTEAVRETAGEHFDWKDLGQLSVRGKKEQLHTFRPEGPGRKQLERWDRARKLSSVPFVGRSNELNELRQILHRQSEKTKGCNRRGGAKHIFIGIRGVAGIGKSRLIHEFRRSEELTSEVALVLKAGCASYAQPSLLLMLSLVRNWLFPGSSNLPTEDDVRSRLETMLAEMDTGNNPIRPDSIDNLALLLSSGDRSLTFSSDISSDESRLRILSSISDLLRVLADSSDRLVVILDDVHWIDSASRECVDFLATSCDTRLPILFILIYRPEPAVGCHIISNLPEEYTASTEITLDEIDSESSRKLIRHLLRLDTESAPAESVVEYLFESSGGNAFFIEELVLGLTENGLLHLNSSGEWKLTATPETMVIPQSIKGLIRARTDQLPSQPRRLLQVASVLGEEFNSEVLFQVSLDTGVETNPEKYFDELLARGFLHPDSENEVLVRFNHVLARDAVYETILKQNRRFLHSLCADVLSRRVENDPDLAGPITRHLADAGKIEEAIPWGVKAQDLAAARYDGDAVLLWSEKLEQWIMGSLDTRDDAMLLEGVLRKRQIVEGYRLDTDQQRETLNRISDLIEQWDLHDLRAEYLISMGSMLRRTSDFQEALEYFKEAMELFRQSGDRLGIARAASNYAKCESNLGLLKDSEKDQRFAVSIFRELGDTENIARSLFRLASTLLIMGRYDEGLGILDEAIPYTRESGNRSIESNIFGLRGIFLQEIGKYEDSLKSQETALAITREVGDKADELSALNSISNVLYRLGRHDEARKFALDCLKASREFRNRRAEANVLCALGLVELATNHDLEALDYFHQSLKVHEEIGRKFAQGALHWNLSLTYYNLLQFEEGLQHAREAIWLYKEVGNRHRTAAKLNLHALVLIEMGRTEEAIACIEEYERDYTDIDDPGIRIEASYARGYLALRREDLEEAENHFNAALEIARENNKAGGAAQPLQSIGMIRLMQGKIEEAEEYLRKGCEALDGSQYAGSFLPDAEYYLLTGNTEEALTCARKALARAKAAGNERVLTRSKEILEELGEDPTTEV
jgi:class 3 adenylate cyclase/tetratricopeptide (TPR) repeat protein